MSLAAAEFVLTPNVPPAVLRTIEAAGGHTRRTFAAAVSAAATAPTATSVFVVAVPMDAAHAKVAAARAAGVDVVTPLFVASALARGLGAVKAARYALPRPLPAAPAAAAAAPAAARGSATRQKKKTLPKTTTKKKVAAIAAPAGGSSSSAPAVVLDVATAVPVAGDLHADLSCIDIGHNRDKYYSMRVMTPGGVAGPPTAWWVVRHWGRSSTAGHTKAQGPFGSLDAACAAFKALFRAKTGCAWDTQRDAARDRNRTSHCGKYTLLTPAVAGSSSSARHVWQFADGAASAPVWTDYNRNASEVLETAYAQYCANPQAAAAMDTRCVRSGKFLYRVSFTHMTQTNVEHVDRTQRAIRRQPV